MAQITPPSSFVLPTSKVAAPSLRTVRSPSSLSLASRHDAQEFLACQQPTHSQVSKRAPESDISRWRPRHRSTHAVPADAVSGLVVATVLTVVPLLLLGCLPNLGSLRVSSLALLLSALLVIFLLACDGWQKHLLALSFCSFYAFAYPGSGVILWMFPEAAHPMLATDSETLSWSLLVGALGWLAFVWGYASLANRSAKSPRPSRAERRRSVSIGRLFWLGFAGIAFRLLVQLYTFYGGPDNLLNRGVLPSILANIGMICTCALWQIGAWRYRAVCLALLFIYCLLGLLSGQRADVFVPALLLTCVMLLGKEGPARNGRSAFVFAAGLAVAIVVSYPLLTRFKLMMGSERVQTAGLERVDEVKSALGHVFDPYCDESGRSDEAWVEAMLRISTRFSHLQYGGNIVVRGHEELGWLYGESLLHSVIAFVPRVLWPDKPTIGMGEQAYHWMGYEGVGSATVPMATDWYLNFGLVGVAAGMFLTGCGYHLIACRLARSGHLPRTFLAFLVYPMMIAGQGISGLISVVAIHGAVIFVLQRMISREIATRTTSGSRGRAISAHARARSLNAAGEGVQPCRG